MLSKIILILLALPLYLMCLIFIFRQVYGDIVYDFLVNAIREAVSKFYFYESDKVTQPMKNAITLAYYENRNKL